MWAGIGAEIGLIIGIVDPEAWRWTNPIFDWAYGIGVYGFVSGVSFGALLSLKEGRKRLFDLSLGRVALWGLLGSAAVPALLGMFGLLPSGTLVVEIVEAMIVTGFLGGIFAPGSIAIARSAQIKPGEEIGLLSDDPSTGFYKLSNHAQSDLSVAHLSTPILRGPCA
jgi:hypothetical protein